MTETIRNIAIIITGLLVPVTAVIVIRLNNIKKILIGEILLNFFVAANYILLNGFSGAGTCILAAVQAVVMYFLPAGWKKISAFIFMGIYGVWFVLSYGSPMDILPFLSAIFYSLAIMQAKPRNYKVCKSLNALSCLIYDILVGAYFIMITHGLLLVLSLIQLCKKEKTPET